MRVRTSLAAAGACALAVLAACSTTGSFITRASSPHEQYSAMLERSGLHETALGRDWRRAGNESLRDALAVPLPFTETAYFPPGEAVAAAYRLEGQRGRRLEFTVTHESADAGRLFVDLFHVAGEDAPRRVAALDADAGTLTYEVVRDGAYVLRVQPELLRGGRVTVVQRTLAALATFPVAGLTARAVQSGFGAERDAGRRDHEGIDIFAPRGTAVVSVAEGLARPDTNTLGGNVVWLRDLRRGTTYYYAHLDTWAIDGTRRVPAGEILGYVGNTGNARTTAPHLHFGIYDDGPIDPLPFVSADDQAGAAVTDLEALGRFVRVESAASLRDGAASTSRVVRALARGDVGRALGVSRHSVRMVLPDRIGGYVPARSVAAAVTSLRTVRAAPGTALRDAPSPAGALVATVADGAALSVLGRFGAYDLVRVPDGTAAWLARAAAATSR